MSSFEVSKKVEQAVREIHKANKKLSYDEIAKEIEAIALKYDLSVSYIRTVSGVEFTNINNLIKYYKLESTKQFDDNYKKLSNTDKARVDLEIRRLELE